jgi:hypothetical protein
MLMDNSPIGGSHPLVAERSGVPVNALDTFIHDPGLVLSTSRPQLVRPRDIFSV